MKKVVIYPGRFQPMLRHHAEVYRQLRQQFPDSDVFIATSDKVELPKSPFTFKEKQLIISAHNIPSDRVLMVRRPYNNQDYAKYFDADSTVLIFAVGEKDMQRFPFANRDSNTGLDMSRKDPSKANFIQPIDALERNEAQNMNHHAYVTLAPTIESHGEAASASAFRDQIRDAPDEQAAKDIFSGQFDKYDETVFTLIYNKIKEPNMNEDINRLLKLAGLRESAPVKVQSDLDPLAVKFTEPGAGSVRMSIANRFPAGKDINDIEDRKEVFMQALVNSPQSLLMEINERLDGKDSNSLDVSNHLSGIIHQLNSRDIGDLSGSDKDFLVKMILAASKGMELSAEEPEMGMDDEDDDLKESIISLNESMSPDEVADQLEEVYYEMKELVDRMSVMVTELDTTMAERLRRGVIAHIEGSLDDEHHWLGRNSVTLMDVIQELREPEEFDEQRMMNENDTGDMVVDGKTVDVQSIDFSHVSMRDYPDFDDVWIESAYFTDGTALSQDQIDQLERDYDDEIYELMLSQVF